MMVIDAVPVVPMRILPAAVPVVIRLITGATPVPEKVIVELGNVPLGNPINPPALGVKVIDLVDVPRVVGVNV